LSNLEVFLNVSFINFKNDFGIFVHDLVRLSNDKRFVSFTCEHQKFNSFLFGTLCFTVVCNHHSALR
jgi:hypothetical protein